MSEIYVVRHGQTQWNQERRYQGQRDIPLSDAGRVQAERAARYLSDVGIRFLVSSDLLRARDTAAIIGERLQLPVLCCSLWRERDYGRWEGLTREEIQIRYPDEWQNYRANPQLTAPGGGETLAQLESRAIRAMRWVIGHYRGCSGVVVSHGALLRTLLAWITHQEKPRFHLDNGGITVVKAHGLDHLVVTSINETSHLADL
ncbi:MAG: histidine phosphatase family protein [Firmicutes bacterium]|nr:histidine phosphatase family protein [Bacillota bacterium]